MELTKTNSDENIIKSHRKSFVRKAIDISIISAISLEDKIFSLNLPSIIEIIMKYSAVNRSFGVLYFAFILL